MTSHEARFDPGQFDPDAPREAADGAPSDEGANGSDGPGRGRAVGDLHLHPVRGPVQEHRDAGADHVCIQVLTEDPRAFPVDEWRALAPALIA